MQTTTKLNRAELLQMALEGKIQRGDKFKDERGDVVVYGNRVFTWEETGVELKLASYGNEHFTPVIEDKEVMIRLKQSEINDIAIVLGRSIYGLVEDEANRRRIHIPSGSGHTALFRKFDNMLVRK
ncbi:hypothetical protein HQK17_28165 [Bacillus cereus]|uniref:hypothetical protein n=1 Tax=Bacillus cereus TaxID=1396 RepID=UPI00156B427A|nr:hypothetical protein [Bacillus cereus]NRQ71998.1 hypothetical protein [Bacillus cereus]